MKANSEVVLKEKKLSEFALENQENLALYLIAMNRFFGIGEKRLKKFLDYFEDLVAEFSKFEEEDAANFIIKRDLAKIKQELGSIGINEKNIFEKVCMRDFAPKKQQQMSIAEASKACEMADIFKAFMAEQKNY